LQVQGGGGLAGIPGIDPALAPSRPGNDGRSRQAKGQPPRLPGGPAIPGLPPVLDPAGPPETGPSPGGRTTTGGVGGQSGRTKRSMTLHRQSKSASPVYWKHWQELSSQEESW